MIIKESSNGKIFILSQPFDSRSKVLSFFYFIVFLISGFFAVINFSFDWNNLLSTGIISVIIIVCLLAAFRFANSSVSSEQLIISKTKIIVKKKNLFSSQTLEFNRALISNFRHKGKTELTNHPLNGQSYDYLGFQTQEKLINEMHGEESIAFDYQGTTITFGNNLYLWEFETIEEALKEFSLE